jgi:hypothetical protein
VSQCSDDLKAFLSAVEKEIMDQIFDKLNEPEIRRNQNIEQEPEVCEYCRNPHRQDKLLQVHPCQ